MLPTATAAPMMPQETQMQMHADALALGNSNDLLDLGLENLVEVGDDDDGRQVFPRLPNDA